MHPNDRKRIVRLTELSRLGIAAHPTAERLWSERLRVPTLLVGLTIDREALRARIDARVDEMVRLGAGRRSAAPRRPAPLAPPARRSDSTSCSSGDIEAMKRAQWRFARRQLTWMRRMEDVARIDRTDRADAEVAAEILDVARLRVAPR